MLAPPLDELLEFEALEELDVLASAELELLPDIELEPVLGPLLCAGPRLSSALLLLKPALLLVDDGDPTLLLEPREFELDPAGDGPELGAAPDELNSPEEVDEDRAGEVIGTSPTDTAGASTGRHSTPAPGEGQGGYGGYGGYGGNGG